MKTRIAILLAILAFVCFSVYGQVPARPDLLEVIELNQVITEGVANGIKEQVEKINENPKVKAVLLVVNTPGGGASASDVIYSELSRVKVPVVGFCEYVCASGGAYALMAPSVKYIGVRGETIGGSIGVVGTMTRFNRLLDWLKIDNETFKSGPLKDTGNPTRDMTDADRKYFQGIVDELAQKFYGVVVKARPKASMDEIKTARIFIGENVVRVGLADAVMTRDEAATKAKELSGSKLIFTREEIKKMSKLGDEHSGSTYESALPSPRAGWEGDVHVVVELLREVRAGESSRFEYRMPYTF
jgi:signal peptide peptidase SppA